MDQPARGFTNKTIVINFILLLPCAAIGGIAAGALHLEHEPVWMFAAGTLTGTVAAQLAFLMGESITRSFKAKKQEWDQATDKK